MFRYFDFQIVTPILDSKFNSISDTKLVIRAGKDVQVIDLENPELTCDLTPSFVSSNAVQPDGSGQCAVQIGDEEMLLSGGRQISDGDLPKSLAKVSKRTQFYSKENQWETGSSMKVKRTNHGCGRFYFNRAEIFVVAGGENGFSRALSTTEFAVRENGRLGRWHYGMTNKKKNNSEIAEHLEKS